MADSPRQIPPPRTRPGEGGGIFLKITVPTPDIKPCLPSRPEKKKPHKIWLEKIFKVIWMPCWNIRARVLVSPNPLFIFTLKARRNFSNLGIYSLKIRILPREGGGFRNNGGPGRCLKYYPSGPYDSISRGNAYCPECRSSTFFPSHKGKLG